MSTVTFGCSASNSAATSSHNERPGSLFWMCHQSMVTASPEPDSPPDDSASEVWSSSPPHDAATSATTPTNSALRAALRPCQSLSITLSTSFLTSGYARPVPRVTIGDVAAEAGVSIATVSKVINGRYGVAPATLEKVQAVVDRLGYESSLVARSLRSRRTNVIGILVADIEPFSAELLKGAGAAIRSRGYELIVYSGSGHGKDHSGWERRYISRLGGTLTDGIILVTPTVVDVDAD